LNARCLIALGALSFFDLALAAPSFVRVGNTLVMSNSNVRLEYNLSAGTTDFFWQNSRKIAGFYSGVTLSTGYIKGIYYSSWSYAVSGSNQVVITAMGSGLPTMKQYFTLDQADSFLVRVDVVGASLSASWIGPVVVDATGGVDLGVANDNRALCVPFDNDHFVRYNAGSINSSGTSYEVGAFYDNTTRNGLVVGSVTHDTWKSGVFFSGTNNKLNALNAYGGAACPWDVMPHGSVVGNTVSSPTVFVGFGNDWRVTLENYAAANTNFAPRLAWTNGVPFGWNSWGVLQQNINYAKAVGVSDFFHTNLQASGFANQGTVYINLDAFWDFFSSSDVQSFANHCHANGQKAGIYFGPFVFFGSAADATNWVVEGTGNAYHYSDILLRDGSGNIQSNDGGMAVDPTHPGTRQRINYYVNLFTNWGFDYVKMDFLSHGAQEGVHYDPNVRTGMQAYNQGMLYVLNRINGRMFISASIAPLFPYQYAHGRRIACDAQTSRIGDTEYTMNSVSYGWWLNQLYQFNDPDVMVFGNGADANENQSRLISGAVTGIFLDGDDLTSAAGQTAAQTCLTKAAINAVARVGTTFTPVEANTGSSAADTFVRQDGSNWCLAIFNYTSSAQNKTVDLNRAGLPPGNYAATNLWDCAGTIVIGSFSVSLNARQAKLFQLTLQSSANLRWNGNNTAVWDTAGAANWMDLSNSRQRAFYSGDTVLFDDTIGVPTTFSVSGVVSPASITVDSSTNKFSINSSGQISGSGGLIKQGTSTLTLNVAAGFSGPATIRGGTLKTAGGGALASALSIAVTNGGTLDFAGQTMRGGKAITLSGAGVGGQDALVNSGGELYGNVLNVTLSGDAVVGGSSRWDFASGSTISGSHKLTVRQSSSSGYGEWDGLTIATNVGDIELAVGKLGIKNMGSSFGNLASTLIVDDGCELDFWSGGCNRSMHVRSNGLVQILTPLSAFDANVTLDEGAQWSAFWGSGNLPMNGTITLNGVAHILLGNANFVFNNVISGPGGFLWDNWDHQMFLMASNIYNGPSIIGNGLTVALSGNGSISHSSLIFFGGADSGSVHLDVSGRPDQTLTLASGQTLAGIGAVGGKLVVGIGATLAPAGTNTILGITTGANPTGTIVASSDIALQGTTVIKLSGSGTNDAVQTVGTIVYGGTLNLANVGGRALADGFSFQIFNASSYAGSFASITPATPGTGLAWDTTQLNSGKVGVLARPGISSAASAGGNLIFSGTNGLASRSYMVLTSPDLAAPLATNTFDATGAFSVTNAIRAAAPQRFYLLKLE
jgi:autotransporter-associated beta strand protein